MNTKQSLEEILNSVSDILFPAESGSTSVEVNSRGDDGDSPLHVMIWRNDDEAVDLLIKSGADVNAIGDMGETPLHIAIKQKNSKIVDRLLNSNAKIDIRSEFGETAAEAYLQSSDEVKKIFQLKLIR